MKTVFNFKDYNKSLSTSGSSQKNNQQADETDFANKFAMLAKTSPNIELTPSFLFFCLNLYN